jgi:hypothetical protein
VKRVNADRPRTPLTNELWMTSDWGIARGFDLLGYHFGVGLLQLAEATIERFVAHATLLYEQGRMERADAPQLGTYVRRWRGWAGGGLKSADENCRYRLSGSVHRALGLLPVSVA